MNSIFFVLLVAFVASMECNNIPQNVKLPKKCEDVLAVQMCDDLRKMAAAFKLKLSRVDDAVIDAAVQGIIKAPAVFIKAVAFIKNDVVTKTCEDLLAPRMCVKLRKVAAALKLKADVVDRYVREAIAVGMDKAEVVYSIVLDFYKAEVKGRTCEDFLAPDVCVQLRKTAAALKVKAAKVEEAVISAVIQGYQNRHEIYEEVLNFYRDEVLSKTCEDFLAQDLCTSLRAIAATMKINAAKVDKAVKEALIKGVYTARDIYQNVRDFYVTEVKTKKCEDFLPNSVCASIRNVAAKFRVEADKVDDAVKSALAKGLSNATDIFDAAVAELKEAITCEDWLSSITCSIARSLARTVGVKVAEVNQAVRVAVENQIQDLKAFYQSIVDFINKKSLL